MKQKANVVLVDDHALFREGLRTVIEQSSDLAVVGEAASARDAVELVASVSFECAVVDVSLPDLSGVSVTREIMRRRASCHVLALSMVEEPYEVAVMLQAGAAGYALKSQPTEEILDAIRVVLTGARYLAPRLPGEYIEGLVARTIAGPVDALSSREHEVFDLLVRGWTNDRVASHLFISGRTVETHRQNIMGKLGAHSMVELVRFAARHRLLD